MEDSQRNLYRVDDVLLRTGAIGLVGVLAAGGAAALVFLADAQPGEPGLPGRFVARHGAWLALALIAAVVSLRVGWTLRRREQRVRSLWALLRRHGELGVPELLANSDFSEADVERTVKLLNTRGLGHYVWDRAAGLLQDGRLRSIVHHVDECEACGGEVSLALPIGTRAVPACPYCGDPVAVEALEVRRREVLASLRAEAAASEADASRLPFSIPVFLLLLFAFWPAAIGYAWWRCSAATTGRASRPA